jgi:AraC-like DNA-binding protein
VQPILPPGRFYGEVRKSTAVADFRFTETFYTPGYQIPRHAHEGAFFGLVAEGAYTERYESRDRNCEPGCLLFHPPGETHSEDHANVPVRIFSIEPGRRLMEEFRCATGGGREPLEFQAGPATRLARRLHQEFREQDALAHLAMEGLALELLAATGRERAKTDRRPPAWLVRARDFLHDRIGESWTLDAVAREVGAHPTHLAREFRRHFRCTPGAYVRQQRVEQACRALRFSEEPLAQIGLALGFSHQAHFTREFKRHVGVTPGVYRLRCRSR